MPVTGDPGVSRFYVSMEDDLMRLFANQGVMSKMLEKSFDDNESWSRSLVVDSNAQRK